MKVYKGTKDEMVHLFYKIDGVQGIFNGKTWVSRANKPLYNLPLDVKPGKYEIYLGCFRDSISACRTKHGFLISKEDLFCLHPTDRSLYIGLFNPNDIPREFEKAIKKGYEGVIVHCSEGIFKIKPKITWDCNTVAFIEGTGKYTGKLGALVVDYNGVFFKVGTGFTDKERELPESYWTNKIVEIEGMEELPSGKLRHPRFTRIRDDLR